MSPLRDGVDVAYNTDVDRMRVCFGMGAALHAARAQLLDLEVWSTAPHDIGQIFIGAFGSAHNAMGTAPSNADAAELLRTRILAALQAFQHTEPAQVAVRDALIPAFENPFDGVDPFRTILDEVIGQATDLFGTDWPSDVSGRVEVILRPPFPGTPFWINAVTTYADPPDGAPSVHLRVNPDQLNVATYGAIFAILVHECVCHVAARPEPPRNQSLFAEGFCDWAAHQLFDRWLHRLDERLTDAAMHFGEQIWRQMMTNDGGNPNWRFRTFGHAAAHRLVRWLMGEGFGENVAVDKVVVLARDLVVLDAPLMVKDIFVRELGGEVSTDLAQRLHAWLDTGHAHAVLPLGPF